MEPRAGVSKQEIREQIWNYMEAHGVADFPRPVHHRIPNFKGASQASEQLPHLQEFRVAGTVKVNPDAPQSSARFLVLQGSHLASQNIQGLDAFAGAQEVKVDPDKPLEGVRLLALQGVRNFSVPVGLDSSVHVDLVVVGSVAVSEKGWRIGKGEGYADLEYAMMVSMGAVREGTPVVTTVHDCQVLDFPEALLEDHDLTVDYILTPTRVIATGCERPKPAGITWSKISGEMLERIPVLRSLRERERRAGKDVTLRTVGGPQRAPQPETGVPGAARGRVGSPRQRSHTGQTRPLGHRRL